jgi:hypothetical protein
MGLPRDPRARTYLPLGVLVYGNLVGAVCGEGLPVPSAPSFAQRETCDLGHEIQLGRPDVPTRRGVMHEPPVDRHPVVRPGDLADDVIKGLHSHVIGFEREDTPDLARSPGGDLAGLPELVVRACGRPMHATQWGSGASGYRDAYSSFAVASSCRSRGRRVCASSR